MFNMHVSSDFFANNGLQYADFEALRDFVPRAYGKMPTRSSKRSGDADKYPSLEAKGLEVEFTNGGGACPSLCFRLIFS